MLPLGSFAWRLCARPDCREKNRYSEPIDRFRARKWLLTFTNDIMRMGAMRSLLARHGQTPSHVSEMSNETVIDVVVSLLISGGLHLHVDRKVLAAKIVIAPAPPPPPPPPRRPPPGPSMSLRTGPSETPTFAGNLDDQAATLVAAAAGGAPFCPI